MANGIQIAVALADMAIYRVMALPWGKIALSLLIAAAVIHVVKAVNTNE